MIDIQCSGCSKRYKVPEAFAGKKTRCKQCSAVIAIPEAVEGPSLEELEPPVEREPEPAPEAAPPPKAPARKPMKLPSRGGAAAGAKKPPLARVPLHARKPVARPGASKPPASRRARAEAEDEAHEVVAGEGGKKQKALLLGGLAVIFLLGGGAGWYFLAGPGAGTAKPAGPKTPKEKAAAVADKDGGAAGKVGKEAAAGADGTVAKAERVPGAPVESLSIIPKDVDYVAQIGVGQIANIPGVREQIQAQIDAEDMKGFFEDAGFDPTSQISRLWIAGKISEAALEGGPEAMDLPVLVLEGTFEREKLVDALKKHSMVSPSPKNAGDLEVYDLPEKYMKSGRLAFPSDEHIVLGTGALFEGTLQLLDAKGSSIKENAALKDYSKDFEAASMAWLALQLPQALKDQLDAKAKEMEGKAPPQPKVDGAFLSIDRAPSGDLELILNVRCPSPEEAAKAQGMVGPLISMARMGQPPEVTEILKGLELKLEGKAVTLSLKVPADFIEKMSQPPAEPGDEPADGEEPAEEEEEMKEDAEPDTKKEAEEPAEEKAEEPAPEEEP